MGKLQVIFDDIWQALSNQFKKLNAKSSLGSDKRSQVFEVIVRQAISGAPWRELCAGPMRFNNISIEEVEAEVRRRGHGNKLTGD